MGFNLRATLYSPTFPWPLSVSSGFPEGFWVPLGQGLALAPQRLQLQPKHCDSGAWAGPAGGSKAASVSAR